MCPFSRVMRGAWLCIGFALLWVSNSAATVAPLVTDAVADAAQWSRIYVGARGSHAAMQPLPDGGYVVAGGTTDTDPYGVDAWVMRLRHDGSVAWQKTFGRPMTGFVAGYDFARDVRATPDGGYIVVGESNSYGFGRTDVWVLKLDAQGAVEWQKAYGGPAQEEDQGFSVRPIPEGGYVVAGLTGSFGAGGYDMLLMKLDASGNIAWQRAYGGIGLDEAYSVAPTADGGYVLAGQTTSFGAGGWDAWVVKVDRVGQIEWQKAYGTTAGNEFVYHVVPTRDGGYLVGGQIDRTPNDTDAWILRLDRNGVVLWQRSFGTPGRFDAVNDLRETGDGGLVATLTLHVGTLCGSCEQDAVLLKLDAAGNTVWQRRYGEGGVRILGSVHPLGDGGFAMSGTANSFGTGVSNLWMLRVDATGDVAGCAQVGTANVPSTSQIGATSTSSGLTTVCALASMDTTTVPLNTGASPRELCRADGSPAADVPALRPPAVGLLIMALAAIAMALVRRRLHGDRMSRAALDPFLPVATF